MKITSIDNNFELYDTTSFLTLGNSNTLIEFGSPEKNELLQIELEFVKTEDKTRNFTWELVSDTKAKAILINWDDPLGITLTEPLCGGTLFDREMCLIFSARKVGQVGDIREIKFSVYLAKEIDNG